MATLALCLAFLTFGVPTVHSVRMLRLGSAEQLLVSDGIMDHADDQSPFLSLDVMSLSSSTCVHMYSFFPCADNIGGYLFQIVVYQYLLIVGEKLIAKGSNALFSLLGTGIFGAIIFRTLMVLPGIVMVIVSGVLTTKENARNLVTSSVTMYAGSTIFSLTFLWGVCVIFGRNNLPLQNTTYPETETTISTPLLVKKKLTFLKDTGITTDGKTSYTAGIMLLSLIPFIIVQLANIVKTSSGCRVVVLIALVVSSISLISYFIYQILNPWIQERSLEYSKYENLLAGFLNHVQLHAKGKLIDENGKPNITVIKRLFAQTDKDADKCITQNELEELVRGIVSAKVKVDEEYALEEVLKAFDTDQDGKISEQEFEDGCKKWIHEAKQLAENADSASRKSLSQVVQMIEKKKHELTKIERLMSRILKQVHHTRTFEAEGLLKEGGEPNISRIKSLFREYDLNVSNSLTKDELKELVQPIKFGEIQLDPDEVVEKLMEDFDQDGNSEINEEEFVDGFTKWLKKATLAAKSRDAKCPIVEFDQMMWKEVDSLVYEVENDGHINCKLLTKSVSKSAFQVILGIAILTFFMGPFMVGIQQLSDTAGVPSFFILFVIIPAAMNARRLVSAIFPASQKSLKTSSLTFSEIYGGVVMNNLMGLSTLLAIVYAKDLTWNYSAEVLLIFLVCAIMGFFACLNTTYPLWTCIVAFFLYPSSVVLFYALEYLLGWV